MEHVSNDEDRVFVFVYLSEEGSLYLSQVVT